MSIPTRRVTTAEDLEKWIDSPAYNMVLGFVQRLQDLALNLTNDAPVHVSPTTQALLNTLSKVEATIEAHPVVLEKDISRFGKAEFRDFYDDLASQAKDMMAAIPGTEPEFIDELATYFVESWGNRTRIDYGSGHELNFISFLLCLDAHKLIGQEDYACITIKIFTKYIAVMRQLQKTYWLEPAGSHGVWGLDDYHFLPFLFGSAQLAGHPHMKPKLIHNDELVEMYHDKYMYLECIYFINNIKTLPKSQEQKLSLRWHSPMLDDISLARSWQKIKDGMIKMYKAEVLGKLPIIQHFMFGKTISCPEGISDHAHEEDDCGHIHVANTWGDCCGIKIPSAIAASESMRLQRSKPVPFD